MIQYSFTEFVNKIKLLEAIGNNAKTYDYSLEEFFEALDKNNIALEAVITGDIAQVTKPLMLLKRKKMYEVAPPSKEAEAWIKSNKPLFKKRYGDDWEQVLYAVAWRMFGSKD